MNLEDFKMSSHLQLSNEEKKVKILIEEGEYLFL